MAFMTLPLKGADYRLHYLATVSANALFLIAIVYRLLHAYAVPLPYAPHLGILLVVSLVLLCANIWVHHIIDEKECGDLSGKSEVFLLVTHMIMGAVCFAAAAALIARLLP